MDFLGWYTTGEAPTERDITVHRQICHINECPVMLMLNPSGRNGDVSFGLYLTCYIFIFNFIENYLIN